MQLRIAGTADDSIVDGEGIRFTVFVQGCPRRCPGCHNPETQSYTGGRLTTTEAILEAYGRNPLLSGITFSGGEP
ncbi:4Fe-4S cluster-binding domain-containing protein, partial [Selenomonas sp.]|uniref:4Fe-4S cluster-binding domain-containing protein n=1 Tax=Selenomonas sp. TaxID=2053611 RepID=UPI002A8335C8